MGPFSIRSVLRRIERIWDIRDGISKESVEDSECRCVHWSLKIFVILVTISLLYIEWRFGATCPVRWDNAVVAKRSQIMPLIKRNLVLLF